MNKIHLELNTALPYNFKSGQYFYEVISSEELKAIYHTGMSVDSVLIVFDSEQSDIYRGFVCRYKLYANRITFYTNRLDEENQKNAIIEIVNSSNEDTITVTFPNGSTWSLQPGETETDSLNELMQQNKQSLDEHAFDIKENANDEDVLKIANRILDERKEVFKELAK